MLDVFFDDQVAMRFSDPTYFKYTGDERDVSGMSAKDYFLENQRMFDSGALPYMMGDSQFVSKTDYLELPARYRPGRISADEDDIRPRGMLVQLDRADNAEKQMMGSFTENSMV